MGKAIITKTSIKGSSREAFMDLRGGEKGTGRLYGRVRYWPQSGISVDKAVEALYDEADQNGLEIVPHPDREDY